MNDDLRMLVEQHLPRLGWQIMQGVRRMPSAAFPHRNRNWVHDESSKAGWDACAASGKLVHKATERVEDTNSYLYGVPGRDEWYIRFHAVDLVDIENVDISRPTQVDMTQVKTLELIKTTNNNASFRTVETDKSQAKTKAEDHSFAAAAEAEFSASITRSAEAGIGIAKGKQELTASFRSKLSTSTDHEWRESDTLSSSVKEKYVVLPFSIREVTIKEGLPSIRKVVPTKGLLDCKTRIDIRNAGTWDFQYLDDIWKCWAGVKGGHGPFSNHFGSGNAVPQSEIDRWVRPTLDLNLEARAERVRYFEYDDNGYAVPGKEAEYEEARQAYLKKVSL